MRILIAPDKFKGSAKASDIAKALSTGIKKVASHHEIVIHPLADGGDGTLDILNDILDLSTIELQSIDPLGRPLSAYYLSNGKTAYIELAIASGIVHLTDDEKDVMSTTTLGTGKLLADAIAKNHKEIILCLGGSCTTDAGLGILHELGFQCYDSRGEIVIPCGKQLINIQSIVAPHRSHWPSIKILSDVENPMHGSNGAAVIFGPQKGASQADVLLLDQGLAHIAKVILEATGVDVAKLQGGGAAGAIATSLHAYLNADIRSGFDYLSECTDFEKKVENTDLVITGEGKLDSSSRSGKVPGKVAALARRHHCKLVLVSGAKIDHSLFTDWAFVQCYSVVEATNGDISLAMSTPLLYLERIGKEIANYLTETA